MQPAAERLEAVLTFLVSSGFGKRHNRSIRQIGLGRVPCPGGLGTPCGGSHIGDQGFARAGLGQERGSRREISFPRPFPSRSDQDFDAGPVLVNLPGAHDGLDVARHVQTNGIVTRMILTSGVSDTSSIPDLDALGPFIRKPYLISRVIGLVSETLGWPDPPRT